jgi:hypothetical protein
MAQICLATTTTSRSTSSEDVLHANRLVLDDVEEDQEHILANREHYRMEWWRQIVFEEPRNSAVTTPARLISIAAPYLRLGY